MARGTVKYNPFSELKALQRSFFGEDFLSPLRGAVVPTTDVYTEGDQRMVVEAHLPNFALDDIDISVDEAALVIRAERRERDEEAEKRYLVRESSMSFYRRIVLPERADEQAISADFREGVLRVTVPFVEAPSPRRVPISTESPQEGQASQGAQQRAEQGAQPGDTAPLGEVGYGAGPAPDSASGSPGTAPSTGP
ncbi:Hsp20/alpha crystallin family protein [Microbacterium sp. DT81.1]|uniref:Hsp20/alpha crystallin family protein n=1 Tax=Microbacterium sp. DT81.1 TaxID=3393413 RepID=UPI003CFA6630